MKVSYLTKQKCPGDLYGLYKNLGWVDSLRLTEDQLEIAMKNSSHIIYAYEGDMLVGTGRILSDGALHTYLCGLGVLEEFRGRGIGAEITGKLIHWCESNGLKPQLNCKESLVSYYMEFGFKEFSVGMRKDS